MNIGLLALAIGAGLLILAVVMAPQQTTKSRQLYGTYGRALTQATGPKEIM